MEDNNVYPLQGANDEYIMTCVIMSGKLKAKEIQRINYCQMHLNVTTIADVTLANGKYLNSLIINGTTSLYSSKSILMDINQAKPGQVSWNTWKKAMKLWAMRVNLSVPLQEWNMVASSLDRHWFAYYEYSNQCIYIHLQNSFIKYERDSKDGPIFTSGQPSQWIPSSSSVPIHVKTLDGAVTWEGEWCWGITGSQEQPIYGSFAIYIAYLPEWES
eukprot:9867735-Ditylum_brightwellii.AAC.1